MIFLFGVTLILLDNCLQDASNLFAQLLINGVISVVLSSVACGVVLLANRKQGKLLIAVVKGG
jgi:hypothetical protein